MPMREIRFFRCRRGQEEGPAPNSMEQRQAPGSGGSFLGPGRSRQCADSCAGSRMHGVLRAESIALCGIHVLRFVGDPEPRVVHCYPAAYVRKYHERQYRIRVASRTSAMYVERAHKKTIQAFKFFRRMRDRANPGNGHFPFFPDHRQ